ncbi:hypothetical protein AGABI1DRAFT_87563 [Agaricus bisporus var. burnettii JB137-S8]|uniref:Uncharacterized protein n=1 Tax=Agaricus bisporus var. burnettii (strain JB137-S8 / ATCC MYA-4627 / FGSC 10392) TaxID=597362 RepID=K5WY93_AGABU|nr:uncharacterized protein AGABI1DRAFT_87563 [Agaricus bisporus var. burnettii JB137-S8]EKM75798.1 hypothetical protein AGABI1DRAFT_87563 [Agaricus bisporus var. burnettii JB137-S8]
MAAGTTVEALATLTGACRSLMLRKRKVESPVGGHGHSGLCLSFVDWAWLLMMVDAAHVKGPPCFGIRRDEGDY